ncbi:MAG: response regulator [Verrucomicrobiota bacterium]
MNPEKLTDSSSEPHVPTGRLLIVDNEPMIVELLCQIFGEGGYEAVGATSAEEALAIWREQAGAFDLVFLDLQLRTRDDGFELAQMLCAEVPGAKIVFLSGLPAAYVERMELHPGINFLEKPFTAAELLGMVKRHVRPLVEHRAHSVS